MSFTFFSPIVKQQNNYDAASLTWKPCGNVYLALAVAVCDTILSSPFSASQVGMNKLLKAYFNLYPIFNTNGVSSAWSCFKSLILSDNVASVCNQLAETLYILTLEGLYENVTRYHEFALPQERRQDKEHWIAKSAPSVIADILGFSIRLSIIASGRPLHASTWYEQKDGYKKTIDIRERHGQYYAKIDNPSVFAAVLPVVNISNDSHELHKKLDEQFTVAIESSLNKFNEFYQTALVMLNAGELNKTILIDLYINNLCPRLHGTQAFFDSIHLEEADHQAHMLLELLDAFARGVALGDFNKDLFYEALQQAMPQEVRLRSLSI